MNCMEQGRSMEPHETLPQINKIIEIQPCPFTKQKFRRIIYLDTVNAYLLVDDHGTLSLLDGSFESTADQIISYDFPIHIFYSSATGSVILSDGQKISIRRDHRGAYSLKTALEPGDNGNLVKLEIVLDEATEWSAYFNTRPPEDHADKPAFRKFGNTIDQKLSKHKSDKKCVVIEVDGFSLYNELISLTNGLIEQNQYSYPVFPYGFALIERLRLLLYPMCPYTPEERAKKCPVFKNVLNSEAARLLTFHRWPHSQFRYAIPSKMAEAGFYHQPNDRGEDRVLCFLCNVCLVYWEPSDEPYQEHERHSSSCRFITNQVNSNVPNSVTMSALAPMPLSLSLPDIDSLTTSTLSSSTLWLAVASSNSERPIIQLIHLDSVTQIPYSFTVDMNLFFATGLEIMQNEASDSSSAMPTVKITALCSIGSGNSRPENHFYSTDTTVDCYLVVGVGVNENAIRVKENTFRECDEEVNSLNTMNRTAASALNVSPRIDVSLNTFPYKRRPMILLYHVLRSFIPTDPNANTSLRNDQGHTNKPVENRQNASATSKTCMLQDAKKHLDDDAIIEVMSICDDAVVEAANQTMNMGYADPGIDHTSTLKTITTTGAVYNEFVDSSGYVDIIQVESNPSNVQATPDASFIYYEQKETSTVAFQCIRLPDELDSSNFEIKQIVASETGIVAVAVNRIIDNLRESFVSSLLIYGFSCGMFRETCLKKFTYTEGHIEQVLLIPLDFFFECSIQSEMLSENAILRFSDGSVYLIDLHKNHSLKICEHKAVDITLDDSGNLVLLSEDGAVSSWKIKRPIQRQKSDEDEELAIAMLASIKGSDILGEMAETFKDHPRTKALTATLEPLPVFQPLSSKTIGSIWKLIQSSRAPTFATSMPQATASASFIAHASNGFQMQAPAAWVEGHRSKKANVSGAASNNLSRRDEFPPPTRSWVFSPGTDSILNSYVFEMAILPGLPISHLNIRLKFLRSLTATLDFRISLLKLTKNRDQPTESMTTSQCATSLTQYSENIHLLREKCNILINSISIAQFMDSVNSSATIQIPGSLLLSTIAAEENRVSQTGWMTESQIFYLILESSGQVVQLEAALETSQTLIKAEKVKKCPAKKRADEGLLKDFLKHSINEKSGN